MNYIKIFILIGFISAQEFEVEGNSKVQGDLIFSDESSMSSASSGIPAGVLVPFAESNQNNDSGGMYYVTSIQNGNIVDDQPHNNMPPYIELNYIIKY